MVKMAVERQRKIFDLTIIKYTIRLRSMFLAHKYNYKIGVILCPYRQLYTDFGRI